MVFAADDVGERGVALEGFAFEFGHETDGDAGHWGLEWHACVHEGENARTHAGHGGGTIGFHHLADNAKGVWEVFFTWEHGLDRTLGEGAVADLAAVLATKTTGLTHAKWREVVVKHEAPCVRSATVAIDILRFVGRSESGDAEGLRLTTGEQGRAVGAGKETNLAGEGSEFMKTSAVATLLAVENADAKCLFLQVIKGLGNFELRGGREFFEHGFLDFLAECADGLAACDFSGCVDGGFDAVASDLVGDIGNRVGNREERHIALGFANCCGEVALGLDDDTHSVAGKVEGFIKFRFGKFRCGAFDHDDLLAVANIDEVEVAVFALGVGGINDELAIDATDTNGSDRACERNVRNAKRGGGAVDRKHVWVVLSIRTQEERDDLGVVEVALREERTQRTIGHAGSEDFLLGGTTFALEVSAGEFADCCGLFLVFDGERKEILTFLDCCGRDGCDDHDGIAAADGYGAVGEFREFAGFKDDW